MSEEFCYVATLGCGCGCAICVDDANYLDDVNRWKDDGYHVAHLPSREASQAFQFRCDRYPHTNWQKRNERARLARQPKQQAFL